MSDQGKAELLRKLEFQERILKGKLQYYVKYRLEIPEGTAYADEQIDKYLDELRLLWELINKLKKA